MIRDGLTTVSYVEQIGQTAGLVWQALNDGGPQSLTRLIQAAGAPRDAVLQAIGWLAREDKLWVEETKRGRLFRLRPPG